MKKPKQHLKTYKGKTSISPKIRARLGRCYSDITARKSPKTKTEKAFIIIMLLYFWPEFLECFLIVWGIKAKYARKD